MATCPRCKGHLTDAHRCPRTRLSVAAQGVALGLLGGIVGLLLLGWVDPAGHAADLDLVAFGAGSLLAIGLERTFRTR